MYASEFSQIQQTPKKGHFFKQLLLNVSYSIETVAVARNVEDLAAARITPVIPAHGVLHLSHHTSSHEASVSTEIVSEINWCLFQQKLFHNLRMLALLFVLFTVCILRDPVCPAKTCCQQNVYSQSLREENVCSDRHLWNQGLH